MTDFSQYHAILGVKPGADTAELKQAYRDLVKIWHPDRFGGDLRLQQKAQEQLKKINLAYRHLLIRSADFRPADPQPGAKAECTATGMRWPTAILPKMSARMPCGLALVAVVFVFFFLLLQKDLAEVSFNFGTLFADSGRAEEALCALKAAGWMNPADPKVDLALGNAYCRTGSYDKAEAAYRKAIDKDLRLVEPQHRLALLFLREGAVDLAIEFLEKAVRSNPSSSVLVNDLRTAHGMRDRGEQQSRWRTWTGRAGV